MLGIGIFIYSWLHSVYYICKNCRYRCSNKYDTIHVYHCPNCDTKMYYDQHIIKIDEHKYENKTFNVYDKYIFKNEDAYKSDEDTKNKEDLNHANEYDQDQYDIGIKKEDISNKGEDPDTGEDDRLKNDENTGILSYLSSYIW